MEYVDTPSIVSDKNPRGYSPIDIFTWWRDDVLKLPNGKFSVIHLDTASEIEEGLVQYIRANPGEVGYSEKQFAGNSDGLFWAAVKSYWKRLLTQIASKVQTVYFTVHLKHKWVGGAPTRDRVPKGKSTLMELASLFLKFERLPVGGVIAPAPSAIVVKHRLTHITTNSDGSISIIPLMPPRIPVATPTEVRRYMLNPPNPDKLAPGELLPEEKVSDVELAELRVRAAEAEESAAKMQLDRQTRLAAGAAKRQSSTTKVAEAAVETEKESDQAVETVATITATAPSEQAEAAVSELDIQLATNHRRNRLRELWLLLEASEEQIERQLKHRDCSSLEQMTCEQMDELIEKLAAIAAKRREASPATTPH
jgi:hypothetical protein